MSNMYERILTLCANKGIKPGKLCTDTGLSRGLMSDLKMGRTKQLSAKTVKTIAEYFGVSTDYLIGSEYGGGSGSGAGFGDGTGYGGPILKGNTAYERAVELCSLYTVNNMGFREVCIAAGLNDEAIIAWANGRLPKRETLEQISKCMLVPVDFLLGETEKAPAGDGKRDILDDVDIAFYGEFKELTEDDKETVRDMVRVMRERRAKKQE